MTFDFEELEVPRLIGKTMGSSEKESSSLSVHPLSWMSLQGKYAGKVGDSMIL
jgi:hypothetical protein